jgi:hypothetical protein
VITTTLFELITEVARHTRNDAETVAVVAEILRRGQVRAGGRPLAREVAQAA